MSGSRSEVLYLVDAHSLIFQVFHAIGMMSSPSGVPTNALFGFTRDLLNLRKRKPDYLVCAFDRAEPTFRQEIYAQYKANRDEMPSDLQLQLPLIQRMLAAMNVPVVSHTRYEADDVVATIARHAAERGTEVYLCTSDKDCRQLIDDKVRLYSLRKNQVFGREELMADWGVTPEQVVDLQTLVGDSVDNVPGVPGIGVKTAAQLLQQYQTLDNLLAHLDEVAGAKRKENLRAAQPTLERTRSLVRLATDVPIPLTWDEWKLRDVDGPKLLELFQEWGFRSMAADLRAQLMTKRADQPELFGGEDFNFGANAGAAEEPAANGSAGTDAWPYENYHLVNTPKQFEAFVRELQKQKSVVFDLETTSLTPNEAQIVGIAMTWKAGEAWYLAVRGPQGEPTLDPQKTLERLRPVLDNPAVAKRNQNIKYDLLVLRANGVNVAGVAGDPMVADYLLHAGERSHNLEELARRYLNHQVIPITDLIGKKTKKQPQLRMDEVPTLRVARYSGEDADVAWRLAERLEPLLAEAQPAPLRQLYDDLEIPLIDVLAELEANGIGLDVPLLRKLSAEMTAQMAGIESEIYKLAGHEFNIGSLPQLRKVLFEELKLPVQGKTGVTGAASTDQETLEKLAALEDHPNARLPRLILEHRQIAKLKGTYVDTLPDLVSPKTGRVHASFNQTVAATGRLSSSDPNLQNIPVRREQGQQIRQAFVPAPGWKLLTADYSQIELRLLAHFTGDAALCRAFAEDRDVHAAVAAQIYGIPEAQASPEMRRLAKTVNFGVIYGMSAFGLSQRLGLKKEEAERFIEAYFARYPKVLEYQSRLLKQCRTTGYVTTILGRRRRIDGIRANSTYQQRNQAEREAINMEIQGSAADLIKMAMLRLYRRMKRAGSRSRMLLQIHDELVLESPPEELAQTTAVVREEMTTPLERELQIKVPLKVDLAAGPNWLDVAEVV
jgi:DNA polymerase-1